MKAYFSGVGLGLAIAAGFLQNPAMAIAGLTIVYYVSNLEMN